MVKVDIADLKKIVEEYRSDPSPHPLAIIAILPGEGSKALEADNDNQVPNGGEKRLLPFQNSAGSVIWRPTINYQCGVGMVRCTKTPLVIRKPENAADLPVNFVMRVYGKRITGELNKELNGCKDAKQTSEALKVLANAMLSDCKNLRGFSTGRKDIGTKMKGPQWFIFFTADSKDKDNIHRASGSGGLYFAETIAGKNDRKNRDTILIEMPEENLSR